MIIKKRRKDDIVQRYHTKPKKKLSKNVVIKFRIRNCESRDDKVNIKKLAKVVEKNLSLLDDIQSNLWMIIDDYYDGHTNLNEDNVQVVMPRYLWEILNKWKILYFRNRKLVFNKHLFDESIKYFDWKSVKIVYSPKEIHWWIPIEIIDKDRLEDLKKSRKNWNGKGWLKYAMNVTLINGGVK